VTNRDLVYMLAVVVVTMFAPSVFAFFVCYLVITALYFAGVK